MVPISPRFMGTTSSQSFEYPHATGVNTAAADVGRRLLWER